MLVDKLRERLNYNPETGQLTWLSGKNKGKRAGVVDRNGYRRVGFLSHVYLEHRLIWLHVYGRWPTQIDHIDRNKLNNRLSNLREASQSDNNLNSAAQWNSKTGVRGVHPEPDGKFRVMLRRNRKYYWGGRFSALEEAIEARDRLLKSTSRV